VYARRGGGISWYLKRGVGLHLVLDVQELGVVGLGFKPNLIELKSPYEIIEKGRHDVLRLRLVLEAIKARSLLTGVEHIALLLRSGRIGRLRRSLFLKKTS